MKDKYQKALQKQSSISKGHARKSSSIISVADHAGNAGIGIKNNQSKSVVLRDLDCQN